MPHSFYDRLVQHAHNRPLHAAVVTDDYVLSYQALLERVQQGCFYLRNQSIGPAAIVGLSLADEVEHLVATLSLMAIGAGQSGLATHDPATSRSHVAQRIGVTHILAASEAFALEGAHYIPWLPPEHMPAPPAGSAINPTAPATVFLRTSGTTGDMNIIAFSEEQLALQADRHADYAGERLLRLAPIEFNTSKRHRLYCIWAGGSNVFRPKAMSSDIDFLLEHQVSCLDISRMHASELAATPGASRLSGIKIRPGGAAVPAAVRAAIMANVTPALYVRYATTESGAISMAGPLDHDADETVGHPVAGVEVQIVDTNDQPLAPGQSGTIRLRAEGMASGYFDSPADTAKRFRDGWFYPGDIGVFRADGQLIVQGRVDDMMVLNGVDIFPAEIEQVLEQHPDIAQIVALSLESAVHGHIPVAVVQLKPGAVISIPELQAYAKERLTMRAPRRLLLVDHIPRDAQGKVSRRKLRDLFQVVRK